MSNRFASRTITPFVSFVACTIGIVCYGLAQCLSLWNFQGDKVDESELVHFAVGFLGGDLNPHWSGYGYVGMLLLGAFYAVSAVVAIASGASSSVLDFASSLFDSGFFICAARLIFACAGAIAVFIYARLARHLGVPLILIAVFIVDSLLSSDGLRYANYVRCDQLVAACSALILYIIIRKSLGRKALLTLPILLAVVSHCKVSALSLVVVLPVFVVDSLRTWKARWAWLTISTLVLCFGIILLNPFENLIERLWAVVEYMILNNQVTVSKPGHFGIVEMSSAIFEVWRSNLGWHIILPLVFLPCLVLQNRRIAIYALIILAALTLPYYSTTILAEYWFIPTFPLLRFIALTSLAAAIQLLSSYHPLLRNTPIVVALAWACLSLPQAATRYREFYRAQVFSSSNQELARQWLIQELTKGHRILLDTNYNQVAPKVYGSSLQHAKVISNAFIYERHKNQFLHQAFELFWRTRYLTQFPASSKLRVRRVAAYDTEGDIAERERRAGAYFVTSPSIYNRFNGEAPAGMLPERLASLEALRKYYRHQCAQAPIQRFESGVGPVIEVYQIPPLSP